MDRRRILKFGALASGLFALPGLADAHAAKLTEVTNQGHIKMQLNEIEILLLSDGHISLTNPQPIFAPGINPGHVKKELRKIFLAEDKLETAINVMVLKKGDRVVLIDTGSGYHFGQTSGWLLKNLEASGIKAKNVTDVFITHAHIDHIGGILDKQKAFIYLMPGITWQKQNMISGCQKIRIFQKARSLANYRHDFYRHRRTFRVVQLHRSFNY